MKLLAEYLFDVCLQLLVHEATRTRRIAYTLDSLKVRDEANPFHFSGITLVLTRLMIK